MRTFIRRTRCSGPWAVRDQSAGGPGRRVGSHERSCRFSQDGTGALFVRDASGNEIATYPPAQYSVIEDDGGLHVHRTGDFDAAAAMKIEPEKIGDNHPAALAKLNQKNAALWGRPSAGTAHDHAARESAAVIAQGMTFGANDGGPQTMQARLKAMNARNRAHYAA